MVTDAKPAATLAEELRTRGIIPITVTEWTATEHGEIVLSPVLSVQITEAGWAVVKRSVPLLKGEAELTAEGLHDVDDLVAAIKRARWNRRAR